MEKIFASVSPNIYRKYSYFTEQFQGEIIRKALHLLIALVPLLAAIDQRFTMALLGAGTLFYVFAEKLRLEGVPVFLVSNLTLIASRKQDRGHFVLGPVTLSLGAMLSLLIYPAPAAAIAIYALAFGDGLASLFGKLFGSIRLPFTSGKTLAGSLACFLAVFLCTYRLTGRLESSLIIALVATFLELFPTGDFDNLLLPAGTGFVASHLLLLA